jgi:V/A-type H+-transporting ATPase subunit I
MIIAMRRIRVLGARELLDRTLGALQDAGVLHLAEVDPARGIAPVAPSARELRRAKQLRRLAADLETLSRRVGRSAGQRSAEPTGVARLARLARRTERELDRLERERKRLEEERAEIVRFEQFVAAFRGLLPAAGGQMQSYHLILHAGEEDAVPRLRQALTGVLGEHFALEAAELPNGERAALLLVAAAEAKRVDQLLARSGIHELPVPVGAGAGPEAALPVLATRREAIDRELAEMDGRRAVIGAERGPILNGGRAVVEDEVLVLTARKHVATTTRSFVVEGWVPAKAAGRLARLLESRVGPNVVLEELAREEWGDDQAPVVLSNPRMFRPFEALTRMVPLPRYGSIDPTPFVAVFFPMFFGLILGDIGYGAVLAVIAAVLHRRTRSGSAARAIAEILGPCAAFAILFGIGFGELFGDLGHRWLGLEPVVLDRERSLLPFLGLALAIGTVHVALGLGLGVIAAARHHPRQAAGRGIALLMLGLVIVGLLALVEVLPRRLFTPSAIGLLIAFPVLVVLEGIIAPIEFLSTISSILSYARIMALGTASVMMAVVANRLAGSFGGVIVGVLFGLLFHLVNFALGVFAPTIHGLRLHYVEFFGKFYSPGGIQYRPFGHWRPNGAAAA